MAGLSAMVVALGIAATGPVQTDHMTVEPLGVTGLGAQAEDPRDREADQESIVFDCNSFKNSFHALLKVECATLYKFGGPSHDVEVVSDIRVLQTSRIWRQ